MGIGIIVLAAFATHIVFNRYERLILAKQPWSFVILLILVPGLTLPLHSFLNSILTSPCNLKTYTDIAITTLFTFVTFYANLVASIFFYRLSPFHPLASYPGPLIAKLTKFWGLYKILQGRYHENLRDLHATYGPYVRIGPNQLSFADTEAIIPILGSDGFPKGSFYEGPRHPSAQPSLVAIRDRAEHARRRKRWDKAFTTVALKDYEEIVLRRAFQLMEELERRSSKSDDNCVSQSVDLARWFSFFAFDFMGDMAFGGGFELMKEGDTDGAWHTVENGIRMMALTGQIPWFSGILFSILAKIPSASTRDLREFAKRCVAKRKEKGSLKRDVFYHLIETADSPLPPTEVASEVMLVIVAGSDTTSTTLSNAIFYALCDPKVYARLVAEIEEAIPEDEGEAIDMQVLASLPYLNAVINETMRFQPVVPSGSQRAPTKDTVVCSHLVPEGTGIIVHPYTIFRDPKNFSPHPDRFIPERWLPNHDSNVKYVNNAIAFMPFSYGFANCVGKNLALMEMRLILALLLRKFDIRFDDGFKRSDWEAGLKDFFILSRTELPVVLTLRDAVKRKQA